MTERVIPTLWSPRREGRVRTRKESDQARGTHFLETTEGRTSQDTTRKQLSKGHSLSGNRRGRDKSGHEKKASEWHSLSGDRKGRDKSGHRKGTTERGALTSWRPHEGGTSQDIEIKRLNQEHSPTGDHRGRLHVRAL